MQLGKRDTTYDILIVIGDIVLANGVEVEQSQILSVGVAVIDAERVVCGICRELRVITLLILVLIVIEAGCDVAQDC